MKSNLLKLTTFFITILLGVFAVWGLNLIPHTFSIEKKLSKVVALKQKSADQSDAVTKLKQEFKNQDVVVLFKDFSFEDNVTMANFEIVNLGNKPIRYYSEEDKGFLLYSTKFNGKEIETRWCGTGLKEFKLQSYDWIKMKVVAGYLFEKNVLEKGEFQVGFHLGVKDKEYEQFWTDKFVIPENLKEKIYREFNNR